MTYRPPRSGRPVSLRDALSSVPVGLKLKFSGVCVVLGAAISLGLSASAAADDWLPHPANAQWQYDWTDSTYNPSGTVENVIVQQQSGDTFTLAWADQADKPPAAGSSPSCPQGADLGWMTFQDSSEGLLEPNPGWSSCPPPPNMPSLCPSTVSQCPDSLSSTLYDVIWGARSPVLSEPLLQGTTWSATGGVDGEVTSTSQYPGIRLVKVPAFPQGVRAVLIKTTISLGDGSLGDDYGSGIRYTWWVRGVGPVRLVFYHADGQNSISTASLLQTNLKPEAPFPDENYFPFDQGLSGKYEWTNSKYMRQREIERITVQAVSGRSAEVEAKSVSGPMRAAGAYVFTIGLDGLRNPSGSNAAASLVKFPRLGHGRHFFTPVDLMTYGFNPVLTAYPQAGQRWSSGNAVDFRTYGVKGRSWVMGITRVHVPAGTFEALEVRSVLTQRGYPFGSGVRTMWFAAGRGLVKLVFKHRDGSTDVVQLLR
jgi:hypothetical protein